MAKLLKADPPETKEINPVSGPRFTLAELQSFVGGYIQVIHLHSNHGAVLVINEEGKFDEDKFKPNSLATELLHQSGGRHDDWIAGDALLCSAEQMGE